MADAARAGKIVCLIADAANKAEVHADRASNFGGVSLRRDRSRPEIGVSGG